MNYKSPKLTVDGILIKNNKILLIKRKKDPFKNNWALPGGFVEYNETIEKAIIREFLEETGLVTNIINLFGVYSNPDRDPRGHTVSIVYLLDIVKGKLKSGDDAGEVKFFKLDELPELSFDHDQIIFDALKKVDVK